MSINIDNTDDKQINLDNGSGNNPSVLNIDYSDNTLLGVDLLANTSQKKEETGYSSGGEESNKSDKSNKEDFNFFADKPQEKNISVEINDVAPPIVDPILENKSNSSGGDFKSIHSMTPNDIKNEKIEILINFVN